MNSAIDISWLNLALFALTLAAPFAINCYFRLRLAKEFAISIGRLTVQLSLVGIYLEFLFSQNNLLLNLLWLAVMVVVGSNAIVDKANLPKSHLFIPVFTGLTIGLSPLLIILFTLIIQPEPAYNAQYLIPVAGMLLGNSLSSNIVALQNLFNALEQRRSEYEAALSLGASPGYACAPFMREAMQKALAPILATMTTTGLVTLPGMMTGQILGGASPMLAIKYQLIIFLAIFVMMSISLAITLQLTLRHTVSKEGKIRIKFIEK